MALNLFENILNAGKKLYTGEYGANLYDATHNVDPTQTFQYKALAPIESGVKTVAQNIQQGGQQLSDIAMQHGQKAINKGYRDEEKVKSVVQMLLDKGYDQNTINQAVAKLDDQGAFQGSWMQNPVKGTMASIESGLSKGLGTMFQGISDIGSAPLQETGTAGMTRFAKGAMETGLGSAQLATSGTPLGLGVNTAFSTDTAGKVIQPISEGIGTGIGMAQGAMGYNPQSSVSKDIQDIGTTAGTLALFGAAQKGAGKATSIIAPKLSGLAPKVTDFIGKKQEARAKAIGDKGLEEIYQAVNPTTRENKAVLRQRVADLLPYIDEKNIFNNELPTVKARVDADMQTAFRAMEDYEANTGVKGNVKTEPIIKSLQERYQKKIGSSYVNPDEAAAAQKVIDLLKGFGKQVKDTDILTIRRAWDEIIKKNKGFMQSAEANIKGEVFNESNKFLRDEIRKSNPEYANYLDKAHKTITLSDVLEATIQRRTGQTQGGFLRQGLENVARTVGTGIGAGIGGVPGAMVGAGATEALISGVKKVTGSSAKLTKGKKLILKSKK